MGAGLYEAPLTTIGDTMTNLTQTGLKVISTAWFNDILAKWLVNECGPKPTHEQLAVPLALGKRPGVEALHIAMTLRPAGCTVRQFQVAGSCGPANNYRRALVADGLLTVQVQGKPYAFVAALTAKGKLAVAAGEKAAIAAKVTAEAPAKAPKGDKPAAEKRASKPRKPKVDKVNALTLEGAHIKAGMAEAAAKANLPQGEPNMPVNEPANT